MVCTYFFTEKMPAIQDQEFIDFSNAILDEKNDFIYELLDTQKRLSTIYFGKFFRKQDLFGW